MPAVVRQSGFTLVEVVSVLVLLGILGVVALGKFQDLADDADDSAVDRIYAMVTRHLDSMNGMRYSLAGSPDNATYVTIDGISLRFRNGFVRNTENNNHVPVGTPNRNNQATRFWYMIFAVPPQVIARNDNSSTGWAMYTGTANCGSVRSRCWKYRKRGEERAVITYLIDTGTTSLVKNF